MHSHTIERWTHDHAFLGDEHERNERRTLLVVALTAAMMLVEIVGGGLFNSMALVADGWHMSTHVLALGIAALAYRYARLHRHDPRFSFGTGKLGELAGFASAIILGMIALFICDQSVDRLLSPVPIAFAEAIPIAAVGLLVNLASAALLHGGEGGHRHHHGTHDHHHHAQENDAHHRHGADGDTNMRAAYVHVLADALISALAIAALVAARLLGWTWLDPLVGLVGSAVIIAWTVSLVRSAGSVLLDQVPSQQVAQSVRAAIETDGDRVVDLHLWRLGPGHAGAILSIVTHQALTPADYKRRLAGIEGLSHVTIEVNPCCPPARREGYSAVESSS